MEDVKLKLNEQQSAVLDYLRNHTYITGLESVVNLGVMDLRKRVSELRRMGYPIGDQSVSKINRHGRKIYYKEYFLERGQNESGIQALEG